MNKKLIRKMLTASGGPLKLLFTPEQIAYFELQATRVPGMNNSGMSTYRTQGVLAQLHLELEKQRKELEIKSRMEMRPVLKRKATTSEKLQGKKDEYELTPQVVGMSGTDPVGEFVLAGIGLNGIGTLAKTGLWNVAKYAPRTQLGNYGRNYFVSNSFKNLFNGNVPKLVLSPLIRTKVGDIEIDNPQLFYRQGSAEISDDFIKSGVVRTSGSFENPMFTEGTLFRKVPTRTKGGLSKGDKIALEGPYSKTKSSLLVTDSSVDMIPADQGSGKNYTWFEDYMSDPFAEESIFDKSRVPLFNGTATSANTTAYRWKPGYGYKKITQEPSTSLAFFERKPSRISEAERLGVPKGERNLSNIISRFGEPFTYDENGLFIPNPNYNFRNGWGLILDAIKTKKIRVPEGDYKPTVLKKYPFLNKSVGSFSTIRDISFNFPYFLRGESIWPFKTQVLAEDLIAIPNNLSGVSWNKVSKFNTIFKDEIANVGDKTTPIINGKSNVFPSDKALFFRLNKATNKYEPYEIIPTSEGWGVYSNKYNKGFSTTYFKYPNYMDEPINIKKKKQGGKMNILEFLKNGSGIYIKKKNRGSFTRWCGGNVTEECIRRGKASSNPKIRRKATFADNVRHFRHEQGGIIKAKDGFNLGQLLNNDAVTGGIQTIIGTISLKNALNKSKTEQEAYLNSKYSSSLLDDNAIWDEVGKNLLILLYLNPDVHFSKIDLQLLFEQAKRKQVLNLEKLKAIEKQQLAYENSLQENATNSNLLSGIFNVGEGALKYISDVKKDKNKNTTPATSNYQLNSFWTNPSLS